ncbi:MAG: PSD1 and planctomycete cytochrome C domain-containing protein, partial [Thermoguttaceae bacterium]
MRLFCCLWLVLFLDIIARQALAESIDFSRDIRPILSDKCFQCHGPDAETRETELRLDAEDSAKADLGGYAAVVNGDLAASELMVRVTSSDESERMPPIESGKHLSANQIELLRQWIAEGAVWSPPWSYVPPRRWELPPVIDQQWGRNWIDCFILSRLETEELSPTEQADAVTLIRRLSFDLTGLPPRPELVARYVAESSEAAYSSIVDELLASPHFGERMAMYWLDLVRFADTVGYHGDQTHNIWPYRDYVVHAFNQNMPFDQFTREQLAGDLMPEPNVDQQIATGYNRLLQTSHEGGVQLKEYRAIYMADRVRNVSQVWMGATVGCAQCHDHKYDPYTTGDFYSLGAFFADVEDEDHLREQYRDGLNELPTQRLPEVEVLSVYQRERLANVEKKLTVAQESGNDAAVAQLTKLRDELAANKALTMVVETAKPREVRLLPRGNWLDESGPIVGPAVPEFLGEIRADGTRATRLDLANWLTDPEHGLGGLTARVMANRFWYLLFGEGLARVLDDLGGQGEPPSHPELLDNLAVEFVESGWKVKHMMKLIVTSSTYRQSSRTVPERRTLDPLNRLVGRQARFRLPAEMVRDSALSISGLLDESIGGPSVKPYQPAGYYQHLNFPVRKYKSDQDSALWRRSVYVHWQRQFLHPMLKALDAPSREECTAKRQRSNTPLAALTLLNDPIFVEAARCFAVKIMQAEFADDDQRLDFAYRQAVSRLPNDDERALLTALLRQSCDYYDQAEGPAEALLRVGAAEIPSELAVAKLAAWTTV